MRARPAGRWAAVAIAVAALAVPARRPRDVPGNACRSAVDRSDLQAVAGAVATWLYCGSGPTEVLSAHGRELVNRWLAVNRPAAPAALAILRLLDPRAAPVVVYAVVQWSRDGGAHQILLTLFPTPRGGWAVDDVVVLDRQSSPGG